MKTKYTCHCGTVIEGDSKTVKELVATHILLCPEEYQIPGDDYGDETV